MKKRLLLLLFLLLLAAAWWVYRRDHTSTLSDQPLADFTIEDTAAVNKIFIVDHTGRSALLERRDGTWMLNGRFRAREDAVNLILKTLSRLKVRGNVPVKGQENMLRVLASSGKKVEVYQGGESPAKIYYVGPATPDHFGTIMLLEIPGIGRSPEPYITHMEGFTGFLSTRFFADETEWRYTGVFEYPDLALRSVRVDFTRDPAASFEVRYQGQNDIELHAGPDPSGRQMREKREVFDTLRVKEFLRHFRKIHLESFRTFLKPEAEDSIKRTVPLFVVTLTDREGKAHSVELFPKRGKEPKLNALGVMSPWDPEYYWAKTEDGYLGVAQMFVFDPILQPLGWYEGRLSEPQPGIAWIR